MTTPRVRTAVALTLSSLLIFHGVGCEESASKQRDEVRVQLAQIRGDLQKTIATGGDDYDASLNKIVTRLGGINGGEPGQQAAKALLAADALSEIAAIHMNAAAGIERVNRARLGVANARINAALSIQSLASGLGSIDGAARRSELQAQLQQAKDGVSTLQARLTELESPINERTSQNTQQKQEIERLRLQVGDLLKQATDLGYSAGLETYKQATTINRQADRIELEVSNREIDLEHDLNPQHKMAQTQKTQLETLSQAIETAEAELDAFSKAAAGDAQTSRAKAAEISKEIAADLADVKSAADGPLKEAYDATLSALEKAGTNARTAASSGDANTGKMAGAALNENVARVHLSAARGLAARDATLKRIKASNGAIAVDGVDGQIRELTEAYQQHIDAAKAALEEAKQAADSISGNSNDVLAFRTNLDTLIAAVSGKSAPADAGGSDAGATDASASTGAAPADADAAPAPGAGAESPEALVESLKSVTSISAIDSLFELGLPPTDVDRQALMQLARGMANASAALDAALQSKFEKTVKDIQGVGGGMTSDLPLISEATLNASETDPTISVTFANGERAALPLSQVNGRWYVGKEGDDGAGLMAMVQMDAAEADAMKGPGRAMIEAVNGMLTTVAADVASGTFATFEEFQTQFDARMQAAMAASMGLPAGVAPNK